MVLVSEPVRGRSRATELPCLNVICMHQCIYFQKLTNISIFYSKHQDIHSKEKSPRNSRGHKHSTECMVCSDMIADVTFEPCGHRVSCAECAQRMKKCLICKVTIQRKVGSGENLNTQGDRTFLSPACSGTTGVYIGLWHRERFTLHQYIKVLFTSCHPPSSHPECK